MVELKKVAFFLPLVASLTAVAGQLLYKHSATLKGKEETRIKWIMLLMSGNFLFLSSIFCSFFAMKFIPLFVVYAFTALNYVFVTISSGHFLKEAIRWNNLLASVMIASGVFLISVQI